MVFLSEDDRVEHHSAAEAVLKAAHNAGLAGATIWRGIEGFGATGHLRTTRFPDLARGLPLVVEIIDNEAAINKFLPVLQEFALGALVTTEAVQISRQSPSPT